ncbi:MAG: hypothetical protein HY237_14915 [Acidobacteria bacterium]|nr:hypothetical protein [Acidobacteriota bacterium]
MMRPAPVIPLRSARCLPVALAAVASLLAGSPSFAAEAEPIQSVLQRTGKRLEEFVEHIAWVRCMESVTQSKLGKNGKVDFREESLFDSLVLLRLNGDELTVDESRQLERQTGNPKNLPLLVTNGFSTLALVFHPYYQASFEFTQLEEEKVDGKRLVRVQFQHVPGTRSPAALELRGHEYPLDLTGIAWIDPVTGAIARITARLQSGLEDLGLRSMHSEVRYAPIAFAGLAESFWLPVAATVDVESLHQHWRNTHRFADYRRYSVTMQIEFPKQP